AVLAARMEAAAANDVAEEAARRILESAANNERVEGNYKLERLVETLAALVQRMTPATASVIVRVSGQRIKPSARDFQSPILRDQAAVWKRDAAIRKPLADLASRIDPKDAAAEVQDALDTFAKTDERKNQHLRFELMEVVLPRCSTQALPD